MGKRRAEAGVHTSAMQHQQSPWTRWHKQPPTPGYATPSVRTHACRARFRHRATHNNRGCAAHRRSRRATARRTPPHERCAPGKRQLLRLFARTGGREGNEGARGASRERGWRRGEPVTQPHARFLFLSTIFFSGGARRGDPHMPLENPRCAAVARDAHAVAVAGRLGVCLALPVPDCGRHGAYAGARNVHALAG